MSDEGHLASVAKDAVTPTIREAMRIVALYVQDAKNAVSETLLEQLLDQKEILDALIDARESDIPDGLTQRLASVPNFPLGGKSSFTSLFPVHCV
jgi:hypothetical protein